MPEPRAPEGTRDASAAETAPDLGLYRVLRDDGSVDPATGARMPDALVLRAYQEMKRLRLLDARMILLQRQGRVGFYGACTGQEATPIATALALRDDDWVFPGLRESVMMLVRGFSLAQYIAQIFGNSADVLKGRQMPSHMSGRAVNYVSWGSCIGTQLPHAVGAAWAAKLQKKDAVTVGFMGDGATSEPDFHNALNFAGVFRVPCLLICQNNHWAISVPTSRQSASATFAVKGRAYGVPSLRVDGNDVLAVYTAVTEAAARARSGGGPTFIESLTYRIGAHSTSDDPTRYRSQEEVDAWTKKDPVARLRRHLVLRGLLDDAKDLALEKELNAEITPPSPRWRPCPPPARETLFDDVYADLALAHRRAARRARERAPGPRSRPGTLTTPPAPLRGSA
jgi:pyruvate dehydrogenase E1 component alpha subunit